VPIQNKTKQTLDMEKQLSPIKIPLEKILVLNNFGDIEEVQEWMEKLKMKLY
jgi:hypothetical protein